MSSQTDFVELIKSVDKGDSNVIRKIRAYKSDPLNLGSEQLLFYYLCKAEVADAGDKANEAIPYYYKALSLSNRMKQQNLSYEVYRRLGRFYYRNSNFQDALVYHNKAVLIYSGQKNNREFLAIYLRIGIIYLDLKNYDQVFKTYNTIEKILAENGDIPETSYSLYNNLAVACTELNRLDEAEKYLKKGYEVALKSGDSIKISRIMTNKGTVQLKRKNYSGALEMYQKALGIDSRLAQRKAGIVENEIYIGETYFMLKDFDKAISILEKAYQTTRRHGFLTLQSRAAVMLKDIYKAKGDFKRAYEFQDAYFYIKDSLYNLQKQEEIFKQSIKFEFEKKISEDSARFAIEQSRLKTELNLSEEKEKKRRLIYLGLITLLIIVVVSVLYFLKQKRKNQQMELEKKLSEARMNALLLQMNPHFVFNSINSVMVLIQNHEKDEALKYLTKFSRVLRLILEGSTKQSVSLKDEINLIQLYVELEQLRFPNSFEFELIIDKEVDAVNTEIPFMVIQPFVENAILHGLQNKLNLQKEAGKAFKGKLKIGFKQIGDKIICEVEDNGIGRKKASEIKESSLIKNQSLGIKVSKERLNLLSNMSCEISYVDLTDELEMPAGTKAIIQLPILNHF